jgi:shikimate dehydrogenase
VAVISGRTGVLAIIADPVVQAMAPTLVNAACAERGLDLVMVPLQVAGPDLAQVVHSLRAVGTFRGAVVSMPHKSALLSLLDDVSPEGRQVGACNVFRREPDGRLAGAMLDGEGFVAALARAGHTVRGRRVLLAGAGGAASAIAFAIAKHGAAALTIHNRTTARADTLVARLRAAWPALDVTTGGPGCAGYDLVVNATSLGMRPGDALPIDPSNLVAGTVAAEIVIRPEPTPFLTAAAARGCAVQHGAPMLAEQIGLLLDFMTGACAAR